MRAGLPGAGAPGRGWAAPAGLLPAGVVLLALGLYLPTLGQYFLADDFIFLDQLRFDHPTLFDTLAYFIRDWGMGAPFYRPLIRLVWAGEYSLFGLGAPGWHGVSLLLYAATVGLVYGLARRLGRDRLFAGLVALLFCCHPSHAETVSWIANQTDLLATLFCLGATIFYIEGRRVAARRAATAGPRARTGWGQYGLALGCFAGALLSKESAAGFFLVPLLYDLTCGAAARTDGPREAGGPHWPARQAPFWALLAGYVVLRLGLFGGLGGYSAGAGAPPVPLPEFVAIYTRWVLLPVPVELPAFALLVAVVVGGLTVYLVAQEAREAREARAGRAARDAAAGPDAPLPFAQSRAALFGLGWTALFLLPALSTAPSLRFLYLPTVGWAIAGAALVAPPGGLRAAPGAWLRLLPAAGLLLVTVAASAARESGWTAAGDLARGMLTQLRTGRPNLVDYSFVYAAGLPDANAEAPIFRGAFPQAVQIAYDNATIVGTAVSAFPVVEQHINQTYFVEYQAGRLVPRDDLVAALKTRNGNLKKEQPFLVQDFSGPAPAPAALWGGAGPAAGWEQVQGAGQLQVAGNALQIDGPAGSTVRLPPFALPAPVLGSLVLNLRAGPATSGTAAAAIRVHWLVRTPAGAVERAAAPLPITADGQAHSYKIKPPDSSAFFFADTVGEIRLDIPPGLGTLEVLQARLNRLP